MRPHCRPHLRIALPVTRLQVDELHICQLTLTENRETARSANNRRDVTPLMWYLDAGHWGR